MRKLTAVLCLVLFFLCLTSCELFYEKTEQGAMRILVYGDTYHSSADHVLTTFLESDGSSHSLVLSTAKNAIPPAANDAVQVGNALATHAFQSGREFAITYMFGSHTEDIVSGVGELDDRIKALEEKDILHIGDTFGAAVNCRITHQLDVDSVLKEMDTLTKDAKKNDLFIFYYSGHGVRGSNFKDSSMVNYGEELKMDAYFWMFDGGAYESNGSLKAGSAVTRGSVFVNFDYLYQQMEKVKGRKLLILDNCYSGCMVQTDGFTVDRNLYRDKDPLDLFFSPSSVTCSPTTFVLAASQYYNTSTFNNSPINSDFTLVLLEGLGWDVEANAIKGKAPAEAWNVVSLHSLASYLHEHYDYQGSRLGDGGKVSVSGGSLDLILF